MIFGLETAEEFPEDWTPLEAIAVVKALDADGEVGLVLRSTDGLSCWDAVALLDAAIQRERVMVLASFQGDGDDPNDD